MCPIYAKDSLQTYIHSFIHVLQTHKNKSRYLWKNLADEISGFGSQLFQATTLKIPTNFSV